MQIKVKEFPEYLEKITQGSKKADSENTDETTNQTPHEVLEDAYQNLRQELSSELLIQIKSSSPGFFEFQRFYPKYEQLIKGKMK